ncbi:hypothetical protein [Eisenbergiella sp.]
MKTEKNRRNKSRTGSGNLSAGRRKGRGAGRIAGIAAVLSGMVIFVFMLICAFFKDESLIRKNTGDRLQLMLFSFGWLLIMLTVVLCAAWIMLAFIKIFTDVVCSMFDSEKKMDFRDPACLKLLSILLFILTASYILLPGGRLDRWTVWLLNSEGLTLPLLLLAFLLACYVCVHIIYKLLEAFVKKESGLKKYLDKAAHMLMGMAGELLLCLLRFLRFVPEFLGWGYDLLRAEDMEETEEEEEMA